MDLEVNKLEHIGVMWQLKWISLLNWWSTLHHILIFSSTKQDSFFTFDELISDFQIWKTTFFHCMLKYFYISCTQNLQFFGTMFLLFYVLLVPSLTVFVSLRQKRWRLLSTINQQYRWFPRCVSALPPPVLHLSIYSSLAISIIYICDPHCACLKESFLIVYLPQEIIVYCKLQRTCVIKELLIVLIEIIK